MYHGSDGQSKDTGFTYSYVYITLIINFSVAYAFYVLMLFYHTLHSRLEPYDPLPKFLSIKAIIFFAFWQVCT